jgi:hypothetical protein
MDPEIIETTETVVFQTTETAVVQKKTRKKKEPEAPAKPEPFPETYSELVAQNKILKGTSAMAFPFKSGLMIVLNNATHIAKFDAKERREVVTIIAGWARKKFSGKWIEGVVLYSDAWKESLQIAKLTGGTLTHLVSSRTLPERWSKPRSFDV